MLNVKSAIMESLFMVSEDDVIIQAKNSENSYRNLENPYIYSDSIKVDDGK